MTFASEGHCGGQVHFSPCEQLWQGLLSYSGLEAGDSTDCGLCQGPLCALLLRKFPI